MELMLAGGAALTVMMLVLSTRLGRGDRRTRERLERLQDHTEFGLPVTPEPLARPGIGHGASTVALRLVPPRLVRITTALLDRAGSSTTPGRFLGTWLLASSITTGLTLGWLATAEPVTRMNLAAAGAILVVVGYGPWFLLRRRATARTRDINRALPHALDLIVTNIECGLGLQAAMLVVGQKFSGPIALEFSRAMREIGIGVPLEEALNAMARRTGSTEVGGVARAIAQAERSGVSVGDILRARASELRERRRLQAREQANKIPVKMTMPMVLFIFPTFFMLLLGPVALNAAEVLGQ